MKLVHNILSTSGKPWVIHPSGQPFDYFNYSPVGDLLAVYSSNNGDWSRSYEYDMLGRRIKYNEDNLATYYTYDGLNPATETHIWQENGQPLSRTITCRYTAHRLDSVIHSDSTLPTVYRYDYAGRVETVLDESGRMDYSYGNMGEVTAETRTYSLPFLATDLALTTQYQYDSWGRTQTVTYPDGETVKYAYDLGGQLYRMFNTQNQYYMDSVRYDKFGAVTSRRYGNGLTMQYTYHPQNRRLTGITTLSGNSQLSHTAYTYDPVGNITQAVSSYPWLPGQTFTENFAYDSTNQLVSAANAQTYALNVTYGDWGRIEEYGLQQTNLNNNITTNSLRKYNYGSLNEGQTVFAPNFVSDTDGTNVNEQYGINGSLLRREINIPGNPPNEELYRFGADGNLRLYSYDRLFYSLYGYDGGTTRTYKYSFDLTPNWVNGQLLDVQFNPHNAMFYPNSYLNFNADGYYTKHYYNGMERIASRLGDRNLQIHTHDPELQDRKDWQDSLIRKNVIEITGYEFLPVGEEQNHEDPKPVFELPQVGMNGLHPIGSGSVYYYHSNHLGSTCYVTDDNRSVVQGFLYAPFGEITNEHNAGWQSGTLPKYSFNAKELDEETGMYYYEARYYAPPVFVSRDRLFEKYPTFSPYAYCANNPVKYVDPDGKAVIPTNNLKSNASVYAFFSIAENNSVFRNVMKRFYSNQKTVYIHLSQLMKDGAPSGRQNIARTEPAEWKLNPVGKYGIERIIINSDILDKSGKIAGDWTFIFNSLLHEGLHAKMFDTRQSDRGYSNHPGYRDFILDRPEDGGHHNQMGVFNRQVLIDGMKEFDSQMGTSHSDEWYEAISWYGLRETRAWRDFQEANPDTAVRYIKIIQQEIKKIGAE